MALAELTTMTRGATGFVPDGVGYFDLDGVCGIMPLAPGAVALFWGAQVVVAGSPEEIRAMVPDGPTVQRRLDAQSDMILDLMNAVAALEERAKQAGGPGNHLSSGPALPPGRSCPGVGMCEGEAPVFRRVEMPSTERLWQRSSGQVGGRQGVSS